MRAGQVARRWVATLVIVALGACGTPPKLNTDVVGDVAGDVATSHAAPRHEFSRLLMGVRASITISGCDEATARVAASRAFDRIAELEAILSDYRPDSELARLLALPQPGVHEISDDLARVLELAGEVSHESHGAFDVTSAPLVKLWREARRSGALPDALALRAAHERVGWDRVRVERGAARARVRVLHAGVALDFGGIGKGFAVDEASRVLDGLGVGSHLIQFGGDLFAGDRPQGAPGWRVRLDDREIVLVRRALSTSGDQEQFVEIGGVRYSHVVDPRSGRTLSVTGGRSAAVLGPRAAMTDAWATALCVLGPGELARVRLPTGYEAQAREGSVMSSQTTGFP
ncbi:MAG: FAD:protein FMN transferase [Planctomycetota bacterium]|nr:FAD:protein FMN transferase [Planctomycetota bacterium]